MRFAASANARLAAMSRLRKVPIGMSSARATSPYGS
jgi:hypothetical protein